MKKRSIFDRLAGTVPLDDYEYDDDIPARAPVRAPQPVRTAAAAPQPLQHQVVEEETEGQLPVDVYQTPNEIVIRTFVAGVRPDDLNVSISRDMVVIEGSRDERDQLPDSDYFTRALFWGSFSRRRSMWIWRPQAPRTAFFPSSCRSSTRPGRRS